MPRPLPQNDLDHALEGTREVFPDLAGGRLFITGGTGFFGHWLLETLLFANRRLSLQVRATVLTRSAARFRAHAPHIAEDPAIDLLEGDIRSFVFPGDLKDDPFTHVIHAATDTGGQQGPGAASELADSILEGTRHVLRFALAAGARRLLFTSTGAVYGRSVPLRNIPESYPGAPDPLLLQSSYDEAKRMSEHLCVAYSHGTPLSCVISRPFAFVGPHLPMDAHFAIGNFIRDAMEGRPLHIRGDGTPLRSFLYTADLAIWLWHLLLRAPRDRAYNVGSPDGVTIAELAHLVACTLRPGDGDGRSSRLAIQIDGVANPEAPLAGYVPDTRRASEELGLRVKIPLAEAIRRTAAWHGFPVEARR